jgi:glutathione synthase/RimK-type ligase-like ATP-grasp enzyme
MILICASQEDRSAKKIGALLAERQRVEWHFVEVANDSSIRIDQEGYHDGRSVHPEQKITAIYYRALVLPTIPQMEMPAMYRRYLTREASANFIGGLLAIGEDVEWINHPLRSHAAGYKARQLKVASERGMRVPETIISSDPKTLFAFHRRMRDLGKETVTKSIHVGHVQADSECDDEIVFTQTVNLDSATEIPIVGPLLFQERIAKDFEVRSFVVDDEVRSVRVDSDELDYRSADPTRTTARPYLLPDRVKSSCVDLTRLLGVRYGAIDLLVQDGEHFFIDFNATGEWIWFEEHGGICVSDLLVQSLSRRSP